MKASSLPALGLAGIAGGLIGAGLVWFGQTRSFQLVPDEMSYPDLAATSLSAVSVLVTILGVFIAILAIWGYSQFKETAGAAAKLHVNAELKDGELKKHVETIVRAYMESEFNSGKLRALLENRVDHILFSGASEREKETKEKKAQEDDEA